MELLSVNYITGSLWGEFSRVKVPPRPPVWLRKVCQSYLQHIISKPDGVLNVLINTVQGKVYAFCIF